MTAEDIVNMIGNIGNRPDIRDLKEKMRKAINTAVLEEREACAEIAEDFWQKHYTCAEIAEAIRERKDNK